MSLFKIKICGIRIESDLMAAVDAGADAIGLNFYSPSVRSVSIEEAAALTSGLTSTLQKRETSWSGKLVGVFVNHSADEIAKTVSAAKLDVIQLHGDERPAFIAELQHQLKEHALTQDTPIIRAVRVAKDLGGNAGATELAAEVLSWKDAGASMVLLDAAVPGSFGGTGARLDWNALTGISLALPYALAGGLNAENVADAISVATPAAVDVASGVENDSHLKDHDSVRRFVFDAKAAFGRLNAQ